MVVLGQKKDPLESDTTSSQRLLSDQEFNWQRISQGTQTRFDFVPEQSTNFIFVYW